MSEKKIRKVNRRTTEELIKLKGNLEEKHTRIVKCRKKNVGEAGKITYADAEYSYQSDSTLSRFYRHIIEELKSRNDKREGNKT